MAVRTALRLTQNRFSRGTGTDTGVSRKCAAPLKTDMTTDTSGGTECVGDLGVMSLYWVAVRLAATVGTVDVGAIDNLAAQGAQAVIEELVAGPSLSIEVIAFGGEALTLLFSGGNTGKVVVTV